MRLHGRNREAWFKKDAGRDARYDHLYSHEEIRQWAERIRLMQRKPKGGADIFIIANNHYRGQAAANALEIVHALTGEPVTAPASLLDAYPRLTHEDIQAALGYAADRIANEDIIFQFA